METKIVLSVQNVDLDDDKTRTTLAEHLDDLGWESMGGQVTAIVYIDEPDTVGAALDVVHSIGKHLPDATVMRVDEQLVAVSDIADRLGLSSEGVRLWAAGKRRKTASPFPSPRGQVSQGRNVMKVWAWADVVSWLRSQYKLDPEPGVRYPSDQEIAYLNAALSDRSDEKGQWQPSGKPAFAQVFDFPGRPGHAGAICWSAVYGDRAAATSGK